MELIVKSVRLIILFFNLMIDHTPLTEMTHDLLYKTLIYSCAQGWNGTN